MGVPQATYDKFANIKFGHRRLYASLVNYVDGLVSEVVAALEVRGMWQHTLIFMSSDNGGPAQEANNWPLRGGKFTNWEGGIHVPAFVSGGALPQGQRGKKLPGLAAVWDFYATFCELAGVDVIDHAAAAAGLPAVDSVSQWSYWSGANDVPPRTELAIGSVYGDTGGPGNSHQGAAEPQTAVAGLINGSYKLLVGIVDEALWTGPQSPNRSEVNWETVVDCTSGCLFDIVADPSEYHDLAASNPSLVKDMLSRIREINQTVFSPRRGVRDPLGCDTAVHKYDGVWGPFLGRDVVHPQLTIV